MSLKKVNLDKLMREESLISEQEEKARALMLKARDRKQRLVRRRARVMMDHLEKVNIDGFYWELLCIWHGRAKKR